MQRTQMKSNYFQFIKSITIILLYKVAKFFSLQIEISKTTEAIRFYYNI